MIKVMIADDERIIREGLSAAIDWERLGLRLVGTAGNGEEAMRLAEETKPDICLVDIMMPVINGLDFIEGLQRIRSDVQFVIITGYDEFEYAQKAIKLKIFDYLLKPIDESELEQVLVNAINKIQTRETTMRRITQMEDQLEKTLPETQKIFITDCLNGKCTQQDLAKFENIYGVSFAKEIGVVLIRLSDCIFLGNESERPELSAFFKQIKKWFTDEIARNHRVLLASQNELEGCIVIVAEIAPEDLVILCKELQNAAEEQLKYKTFVFCAGTDNGINTVDLALAEINKELTCGDDLHPLVRMAKKYIDDHYMESDLTLNIIADALNVSCGHLSRLFKKEMGISYSDYLESIRINKAMSLLRENNRKIYEIAELSGYASQHYFCSIFKKVMGISPSEYQRSYE